MNNRLIKSNDAGGCTNTVDLYNPFPDGGGVALYQLNGDATDVSGNYNGTASNVTYGAGVFGQAGVFNGSSSYVNLNSSVISANSSFSISHWVKFDTLANGVGHRSIHIGNGDAPSGISIFGFNGVIYLRIVDNSGTPRDISYSFSINVWYNLVITYDNSSKQFKGYVNNVLINTLTITGFNPLANYGAIGSRIFSSGSDQFLDGSIDQVRIFNRALRPYEVEALYTEEYCTPTIVPSEHFNTVTWTGDNTTTRAITGVGFAPDFVWQKRRDGTYSNLLFDSVRGATNRLISNSNTSELSEANGLKSFDADGFTIGNLDNINGSGGTMVAWNFKAGGAAVTNTDGTITSQVSANTEAGFSVVSWTSTGSNTSSKTVGHGLEDTPNVVILKNRSATNTSWRVYHSGIPSPNNSLALNGTEAAFSFFPSVSSTNFGLANSITTGESSGASGQNIIAYCFAEVEGFSSFGSYVGNGTSKTIVTGFEPAFVMFKVTSEADHWLMFDNKRGVVTDETGTYLIANLSQAEGSILPSNIKFLANGFEITGSGTYWNKANASYIYMAFAADPTTIEPSLADSFNTVVYSGNGASSQSIIGVGFQPDMVWQKHRRVGYQHNLMDSVRGANTVIFPDNTELEDTSTTQWLLSFNNDGFTTGSNVSINGTNGGVNNMVAWCWKGAELPAINSNGSIPSVVSANPAAGFSIVSYTGNNIAGATIGHGLEAEPDMIIVKNRDTTDIWTVQHSALTYTDYIDLNNTNAGTTNTAVWYAQPTTEVFSFGANPRGNGSGNKHIAYCFAEVAGFSKFGSYSGNGTSQTIYTTDDGTAGGANGFEPAFVMLKRTNASGYPWAIADNKRVDGELLANAADAERNENTPDFISNGFTMTTNRYNDTGEEWIYMAFANQF